MKHIYLLLDTATYSGREILRGVFSYAKKVDWVVEFEYRGLAEPPLEHCLDRKWDGIIMRSVLPEVRERVRQKGVAHVELLGSANNPIQYDIPKAVAEAVQFMQDLGETRLAYYTNIRSYWSDWSERQFLTQSQAAGIETFTYPASMKTELNQAFAYRSPELERQFIDWFDSLPKPIGVLAPFPFFGARVVNACYRLGLTIPSQVSILTASNDETTCESISPSLSCLRLNSYQFGYEAARLLEAKMNGKPDPKKPIMIPPLGVVVRNSTRGGLAQNPDIQRAVQLIRENATRGLTVQELLDQLSISRRTLERKFLQILGRTPSAEIDRIQMETAEHQLKTTDMSVSEIARQCGFSSPVYFSVSFRNKYGLSPSKYRKEHAKQ